MVVLIYINLMIIDAENLLMYLFIICRSSLEKCLFNVLNFLLLYATELNEFLVHFKTLTSYWTWGLQLFFPIPQVAFSFIDGFLFCAVFQFNVVPLVYFCFCCFTSGIRFLKKIIAKNNDKDVFFQEFNISCFVLKSQCILSFN